MSTANHEAIHEAFQSTLPHPITLQKKKRNQKTRLQYKRRSLQVKQEYTEKPSENQACITKNMAQISVESSQCSTKIPRNSGILSVLLHRASKQICGDVILPAPLAIAMASIPTYIQSCNDFEASGEG